MKKTALLTLISLFLLALPVRAQINLLHEFADGASDGSFPYGSLVISGSTLYGMTYYGGDSAAGTIFKIEANGNGFALLHEFAGGTADGALPLGDLIISGSTLYGMTKAGGDNDCGTIFKIQTDGNGFTLLHEFAGSPADGSNPNGSLIISGSTLYGMTSQGGNTNIGTIFKIQTDGNGYTILIEIGSTPGYGPLGALILSGSTLYGMTYYGGANYKGTIFNMQTNGSGFTVMHEFAGGTADGAYPNGALIISGSTLYGMTYNGGDSDKGVLFEVQTNGTGFNLLHEFAGGADDGSNPYGSLLISGTTLYGMTIYGGNSDMGTIFKVPTNDAGYTLLHRFAGGDGDGANPWGSLIISGSSLYGMTHYGGDNGDGVIFSLPVPSTSAEFIGTWDGQGVYYRNSETGVFVKLATPATLITAGDLDGDGIDDLVGIWPGQGGVWVKYSQSGAWAKLSSTAIDIASGDMNGDGRVDLVATWDGQGVYYRNSIGGAWIKMATPAEQVTAGDLDGDGKDDIVGIWPAQGGVWVKYSAAGNWAKLSSTAIDIACGDMNGDGRDDLVATWDGQGVYYKDSISGAWVMLATPATLVAAGDLDGDGKADVIGIWPGQGGVWVKYSQTGSWAQLSSTARHIAAGLMRGGAGGSATQLAEPFGGAAAGPESFGYSGMAAVGPGDRQLLCQQEKNLNPQDRGVASAIKRVPGPGEYGFQCQEQENLVPGSGITKEPKKKEQRQQQ